MNEACGAWPQPQGNAGGYATTAASSVGGVTASLSQTQLGDLGQALIGTQFSQRQETEADDYSFDLLKQRHIDPIALVTSFEKLAKLESGQSGSSLFDSHPASAARAQHIRDRIAAEQ